MQAEEVQIVRGDPLMRRRIKAALALAGLTQAELARELGVAAATVCQVVGGVKRSRRIQDAIAAALRLPFDSLWTP